MHKCRTSRRQRRAKLSARMPGHRRIESAAQAQYATKTETSRSYEARKLAASVLYRVILFLGLCFDSASTSGRKSDEQLAESDVLSQFYTRH